METYVSVKGGRVFVVDEGTGPPVVLIHSAIADLRSWGGFAPLLVAAGYRVVRYDYRGFGRCETEDVEYSDADDLLAVLDALAIKKAVLIGNSRGARIALDAALVAAARVVAVEALGAGLDIPDSPPLTPAEAALDGEEQHLLAAGSPDVEALVDLDVRAYVDGPGQPPDRVASPIRELVREMDRAHRAHTVLGRRVPLQPPAVARLGEIACPVLAIAGALDLSNALGTTEYVARTAPRGERLILSGLAHLPALEDPERVAAATLRFLGDLPAWA